LQGSIADRVRALYDRVAMPADTFAMTVAAMTVAAMTVAAMTVAFAMSQPDEVDINQILFRPTAQEY
jgi:NADP-dependent 3-hydroxy acid dehydrogenase YdfG